MRSNDVVRQALSLGSQGVSQRVASGAGFQFLGIALRTVLTIGSTAILARLLTPADFGYVAMATVVTEFAGLFGAFGFTNVLIQRRRICRLQMDTVFWATFGVGFALALVVLLLSLVSHWLFADPKVAPLLRVLCLAFVFNSLAAVPWVLMARLMRFRTEFLVNLSSVVLRMLAAVACAWAGWGVWSLVVGALVGAVATAALSFAAYPFRPRLRFHAPFLTSTWRTSGSYFGNTTLHYINCNLDLMLIGRGLGASALGYYQNARSLTDEIRGRIATPIQHVLFPAFSALHSDRTRVQKLVLHSARLLAAIVIPIGVGVSANAEELVQVLYGQQWSAMTPVMSMFGLSAALRASTAVAQPLFNATNRVGLALRFNLIGTLLLIGGVLLAMRWGITAVALAVALTSLYSLVSLRAAFGLIGLDLRALLSVVGPPALASASFWLATPSLRSLLNDSPADITLLAQVFGGAPIFPNLRSLLNDLPITMKLLAQVLGGATIYLLVLHVLSRQYFQDFRQAIAMVMRKKP